MPASNSILDGLLDDASSTDLKSLLGLTQGNLGVHLRKLEEAGYVEVRKAFVDRKPRKTAAITATGRAAFLAHVEQSGASRAAARRVVDRPG